MSAHLLPGFAWMPGMCDEDGRRVVEVGGGVPAVWVNLARGLIYADGKDRWSHARPYYADPATGGCLVTLLGVDAWRVDHAHPNGSHPKDRPWKACMVGLPANRTSWHASQGEACAVVAEALGRWPGGVA